MRTEPKDSTTLISTLGGTGGEREIILKNLLHGGHPISDRSKWVSFLP